VVVVVTIRYDSVYLTCSKQMTGSQLSPPHGKSCGNDDDNNNNINNQNSSSSSNNNNDNTSITDLSSYSTDTG